MMILKNYTKQMKLSKHRRFMLFRGLTVARRLG